MDTIGIVLVFSVLVGLVDVCFSAGDWRFKVKNFFTLSQRCKPAYGTYTLIVTFMISVGNDVSLWDTVMLFSINIIHKTFKLARPTFIKEMVS